MAARPPKREREEDELQLVLDRQRALQREQFDLDALLATPCGLAKLPGSGAQQAPALVELLCAAGVNAVHQVQPPGVAAYLKPDCASPLAELPHDHALLWLMVGLAQVQGFLESAFRRSVRRRLLARRLAARLRQLRPDAAGLDAILAPLDAYASDAPVGEDTLDLGGLETVVNHVLGAAAAPMAASALQLEREWLALVASHSSLANVCLAAVCAATGIHVHDAVLLTSADETRVRVQLQLYDTTEHAELQRPRPFYWSPSLGFLLRIPNADTLAGELLTRLWAELRSRGYWPSAALRAALAPPLRGWFASCVQGHGRLRLRAELRPSRPLCLYLHGPAGAGKSSLLRALLPALLATARAALHPQLHGRFVKQNLNKALDVLEVEFERRPSNNDLSIVRAVEMAREPLAATEPRVLLLGLEEMPSAVPMPGASGGNGGGGGSGSNGGGDDGFGCSGWASLERNREETEEEGGHQLAVAELLAKRFRRLWDHGNSSADLLVAFTSNYALRPRADVALREAPLFRPLRSIEVAPLDTAERREFAVALLRERMAVRFAYSASSHALTIDISAVSLGDGDLRPLVRWIRSLAVHAAHALSEYAPNGQQSPPYRLTVEPKDPSGRTGIDAKLQLHVSRDVDRASHGQTSYVAPDDFGNLTVDLSPSFVPRTFLDVLRHELTGNVVDGFAAVPCRRPPTRHWRPWSTSTSAAPSRLPSSSAAIAWRRRATLCSTR